jgi:copper chaperone CopZ
MKKLIAVIITVLFAASAHSQSEIKIKTSAICEQCKKRLESNLIYEKGIKFVKLNLDDKVLTVDYNPNKTSPEKIKAAISKIGYDADDVAADSTAYLKLPSCCKKDAEEHKE